MEAHTIIEVVNTLIGEVRPIGLTHIDDERFKNLETMVAVVENLLNKIESVAENIERDEFSMRRVGVYAATFLNDLKQPD